MPKERTYTDTGYIEIQWAKNGRLLCIVSAETTGHAPGCHNGDRCGEPSNCPPREHMHQFTDSDDLGSIIPALKRAKRQAFGEPTLVNDGWLKPGQVVVNLGAKPEPVLTGEQWRDLAARSRTEY